MGPHKNRCNHSLRSCLLGLGLAATTSASHALPLGPTEFCGAPSRIDYETGTNRLPIVPGVRFPFEGIPDVADWYAQANVRPGGGFPVGGVFGAQCMANFGFGKTRFSDLLVAFNPPQPAAGAWVGNIFNLDEEYASQVTLRARSASGVLLDEMTVEVPPVGAPPVWLGFQSPQGIARLEFRVANTGFACVDEVTYGLPASACPSPLEVPAVSGLGLGALAFALAVAAGWALRR